MIGFQQKQNNYILPFVVLSILFFMWGLITVISDVLIIPLDTALQLNINEKRILTLTFFATYLFVGLPAGKLIDTIGYRKSMTVGVIIAAVGCFIFYIAAQQIVNKEREIAYALTLLSLFLLASGITILQVGANAYVVLIGMRGKGAQRLMIVQAFNSLGTVTAILFATKITSGYDWSEGWEGYAKVVQTPYLILGGILILIAGLVILSKLPKLKTAGIEPLIKEKMPPRRLVWEFPHVTLGAMSIFLYVGAEVMTFRFLQSKESVVSVEKMLMLFWIGLLAGRFLSIPILSKVSPRKLITTCSIAAAIIIFAFIIIVPKESDAGWEPALWLLTSLGLFNAVLFPCIFTMGIDGLGKFSEEASSVLVMSIFGGAAIPFVCFTLINPDNTTSVRVVFLVILFAYAFIAFFGFKGSRYEKQTNFY